MLKNLCWEDQDTDENILQFKEFRPDFFVLCCRYYVRIVVQILPKYDVQRFTFYNLHYIPTYIFNSIICNVSFLLGTITIVKCT